MALDASSTTIGWSLWDVEGAPRVLMVGTLVLDNKSLAARLSATEQAMRLLAQAIAPELPDLLAVEGVAYASNRRDEQQQVMGVIRKVAYELWGFTSRPVQVPPMSGKLALTTTGTASKELMMLCASVFVAGADEHAADSVGVALCAMEREGLIQQGAGSGRAVEALSGAGRGDELFLLLHQSKADAAQKRASKAA